MLESLTVESAVQSDWFGWRDLAFPPADLKKESISHEAGFSGEAR